MWVEFSAKYCRELVQYRKGTFAGTVSMEHLESHFIFHPSMEKSCWQVLVFHEKKFYLHFIFAIFSNM